VLFAFGEPRQTRLIEFLNHVRKFDPCRGHEKYLEISMFIDRQADQAHMVF
jgi:hypothetical protein